MSLRALDVELIHRAFSPAQEIHDPEMFVGRRDEIESGISAMMNPGGFLVIYGLRGVGKSSIAYQLALIAQGHDEVPRRLGIRKSMPHKGFHYLMHYVRCDGYVSNILRIPLCSMSPEFFNLLKRGHENAS